MGVMPTPKSLTSEQARRTLVHRYTRKADQYRQLYTKYGLHDKRVFLVWAKWDGEERGEGRETIISRFEILPTPRVSTLTSVGFRPYSHGTYPEGSIRIDRITAADLTEDMLRGLRIPKPVVHPCGPQPCGPVRPLNSDPINASGVPPVELTTDVQTDFWWEVYEDGRGDNPPERKRFRVLGIPGRETGKLQWVVNLEDASKPTNRVGTPEDGVVSQSERNDLRDDNQLSLVEPTYEP